MSLLELDNVSVQFGGLRALTAFDFALERGELVGLIGPNGAGKTTAFNVVTGVYRPCTGRVLLDGHSIAGLSTYRINRAGLARTFQNIRLFAGLSVLENVLVGIDQSSGHSLTRALLQSPGNVRTEQRHTRRAMELLETLDLADRAGDPSTSLPYGDQRRLEIARALATEPKILCLDEPAAGMNPREKLELMDLIRLLRDRVGVGIWLIEHDMKLVMTICQRITVLDHGETIAVGSPAEIQCHPRVIEAYLGEAK